MKLTEILRRRGVPFRTGADPSEISLCCLFCTDRGFTPDTRFRLGINLHSGAGHCFNCGWKSRNAAGRLVLRKLGVDEVLEAEGDRPSTPTTPLPEISLPPDFTVLSPTSKDPLEKRAWRYVTKTRGILPSQIREKQIGVSFVGEYAYRVIIPVFSGSSLKGIVGRDFTGKQTPKYRNSRGDKYLFNFDPSHSRVILCEGVFKALRLEQALPRYNCCAMLGHDLTSLQEEQIRSGRCKEVLIWPDPDRAGTLGAIRTADLLSERFRVSVAWPLSLPADEASLNELQESARSVKPYGWRTAQELLYFPHRVLYTMHSSKTDCEVPR